VSRGRTRARPAAAPPGPPARAVVATPAAVAALAIVFAAALAAGLATLARGIDLTDEGSYLLGYAHPRDVVLTLTHFQPLVAALAGTTHAIAAWRALGLACAVLPAAWLGWTARRLVPGAGRAAGAGAAAAAALAGVTGWASGPRTLSYNGIVAAATLAVAAIAVQRATAARPRAAADAAAGAAAGIALGIAAAAKAPSAALVAVWFGVAVATHTRPRLAAVLGGAIAGFAAFAALFFARVVPPGAWWGGITAHLATSSSHAPAAALAANFGSLPKLLLLVGPVVAAAVALVAAGRRRGRAGGTLVDGGVVLLLATALACGLPPAGTFAAIDRTWLGALDSGTPFVALLVLAAALAPRAAGGARRPAWPLLLAVLPLLASAGTSNALTGQVVLCLAPWLVALWLVAAAPQPAPVRAWPAAVLAAACVIAAVQACEATLLAPYRVAHGMAAQRVAFAPAIAAGRGLLVDADTAQLADSTRAVLDRNGFRAGDPVLAFHDLPGLVYLVGGRSPELPWYSARWEPLSVRAIERVGAALPHGRLFVLQRDDVSADVVRALLASGFAGRLRTVARVAGGIHGTVTVLVREP